MTLNDYVHVTYGRYRGAYGTIEALCNDGTVLVKLDEMLEVKRMFWISMADLRVVV